MAELLTGTGVTATRAATIAATHPPERIRDVVDAVSAASVDNAAGWIIAALHGCWDIAQLAERARHERRRQALARRQQAESIEADRAARTQARQQQQRSHAWANLAANTLHPRQLRQIIRLVHDPRFPASNSSVRLTTARVIAWTATACLTYPDLPTPEAIRRAIDAGTTARPNRELPPPPPTTTPATDLARLIATHLEQPEQHRRPAGASMVTTATRR